MPPSSDNTHTPTQGPEVWFRIYKVEVGRSRRGWSQGGCSKKAQAEQQDSAGLSKWGTEPQKPCSWQSRNGGASELAPGAPGETRLQQSQAYGLQGPAAPHPYFMGRTQFLCGMDPKSSGDRANRKGAVMGSHHLFL